MDVNFTQLKTLILDYKAFEKLSQSQLSELKESYETKKLEHQTLTSSLIASLKDFLGEENPNASFQSIFEKLEQLHNSMKVSWIAATDERAHLRAITKSLNERISVLKTEIENLKDENNRLQSLRKQSHPDLSALTKLMDVEYKQNIDFKINHATIRINDDERHKFSSLDELAKILGV